MSKKYSKLVKCCIGCPHSDQHGEYLLCENEYNEEELLNVTKYKLSIHPKCPLPDCSDEE